MKRLDARRYPITDRRTQREMIMTRLNADVLTTRVADGIAVITLGSARRIYFDEEMRDALTEALDEFMHQ